MCSAGAPRPPPYPMNLTTMLAGSAAGLMYHARTGSPPAPENSTSNTRNGRYTSGSYGVNVAGWACALASSSRSAHQASSPAGSLVSVRYSRSRSSGMSYQGI